MQAQRIEEKPEQDRFSGIDHQRAVLDLMLVDIVPWSIDEIAREISGSRLEAVDAVSELAATGLVHRAGDFVFPTRSARWADRIANS